MIMTYVSKNYHKKMFKNLKLMVTKYKQFTIYLFLEVRFFEMKSNNEKLLFFLKKYFLSDFLPELLTKLKNFLTNKKTQKRFTY